MFETPRMFGDLTNEEIRTGIARLESRPASTGFPGTWKKWHDALTALQAEAALRLIDRSDR